MSRDGLGGRAYLGWLHVFCMGETSAEGAVFGSSRYEETKKQCQMTQLLNPHGFCVASVQGRARLKHGMGVEHGVEHGMEQTAWSLMVQVGA